MRTIKLKVFPLCEAAIKKDIWKRIRQLSYDTFKAANEIVGAQAFNDHLIRRLYSRLKIDPKDLEAVSKVEQKFKDFFGVKRQATSERDLKQLYPNLPSCITNPLNNSVYSLYVKEKPEVLKGNRSQRSFRKTMPMPIQKSAVSFIETEKGYGFNWTLNRKEKIKFAIYFGKDLANNRHTVSEIYKGNLDYGAPSLQLKDKNLFLLIPVKDKERDHQLNPKICVGVDLGLSVPAYITLNTGPERKAIGCAEDFLRVRMQMQQRYKRLQKQLGMARGGKGRKKKLKALFSLKQKEKNFARSYNHSLSKAIIDFALRYNAGIIKLEFLKGFSKNDRSSFILRNWSYFQVQEQLKYKAKAYGITIKFVDPYHTSQTCSECHHYEKGQRIDQKTFTCKNCNFSANADYNAARNIANSTKYVTKVEQCQFYKQRLDPQPNGEEVTSLTNPMQCVV